MKKILLFIIPLFLIGCGINTTPYLNDPVTTKVNLERANYRIVKQVDGYASSTYVFGIGGLSKKALEGNAVADMYKNADLKGNQQIINITTTQSYKLIILYGKRQIRAHGIVIEFIDGNSNNDNASFDIPSPTSQSFVAEESKKDPLDAKKESIEKYHNQLIKAAKQYGQYKTMPLKSYERLYTTYTLDVTEENLSQLEQIQKVMLKYITGNLPADFEKAFTNDQSTDVIVAIFKQYM